MDEYTELINELDDANKREHELKYHVLMRFFNICGCFDSNVIEDWIKIMKELENRANNSYITHLEERTGFNYNYIHTILHILDNAGLIEHGTSIRGSWLTDKGSGFLAIWYKLEKGEQ